MNKNQPRTWLPTIQAAGTARRFRSWAAAAAGAAPAGAAPAGAIAAAGHFVALPGGSWWRGGSLLSGEQWHAWRERATAAHGGR